MLKRVIEPKQPDTNALKQSIAETLQKQGKRIVIVIDDIDRLTPDEIRQLFRVIKAVADFPNVLYLLAFDREIVVKALTEKQDLPGDQYLEKIVQVPVNLPAPDRTALQVMLSERLGTILRDTPEELFDQDYWQSVYLGGIDQFIATPRDVVRLANAMSITYTHLRGEVNAVDFIALEVIRLFQPSVYHTVRNNEEYFAGFADFFGLTGQIANDLRQFHDGWIKDLPENRREPIQRLLARIFPKLEELWRGTHGINIG